MKVTDARQQAGALLPDQVSILVLLDEGHRHFDRSQDLAAVVEFQSLFSWMKVTDRTLTFPTDRGRSEGLV